MSEELRQHIRLPFNAPLSVQIAEKASWIEGICTNMSGGGVLITTQAPIAVDTEVNVQLRDSPEKFKAHGSVTRLVEDGDQYLVAIKYKDLNH